MRLKNYAAILFLSAILSCSKKQIRIDKSDILTTGSWKLSGYMLDDYSGYNDMYTSLPDCRKDDFIRFNRDGTEEINEGPTMCNTTDPQSRIANWRFPDNYNSRIEIDGKEYVVDRLENTEFRIHTPRRDPYASQTVLIYHR